MKFAFITEEKVAFPVAALCRLLVVSSSGYYAALGRPRSRHDCRDERLAEQVIEAHLASKRRYGSPRIHAEIKATGERVGRKRVARLMRERKLVPRTRRRFRTTTDSKHDFPIAPNVLERDFAVSAPDRAWVTDITFVWTAQGWLYLAVILDLFCKRCTEGT
jgi:putative transposase